VSHLFYFSTINLLTSINHNVNLLALPFIYFIDNGFLTLDTLTSILLELEPNLSQEELAQIIEEVDEDGSGTIDFDGKKKIIMT